MITLLILSMHYFTLKSKDMTLLNGLQKTIKYNTAQLHTLSWLEPAMLSRKDLFLPVSLRMGSPGRISSNL